MVLDWGMFGALLLLFKQCSVSNFRGNFSGSGAVDGGDCLNLLVIGRCVEDTITSLFRLADSFSVSRLSKFVDKLDGFCISLSLVQLA